MTLAWLRLRVWLGWGNPAEALQPFVRPYTLAWFCIFVFVSIVYGFISVPQALPGRRVITLFVVVGIALAFSSPLGLRAISLRWLVRRGANVSAEIVTGSCFACLPNAPWVFAHIGWTQETATGYNMPIEWDGVVASGAGAFELLVDPATGFVERLRRLGGSSRELTRTWDDDPVDDSTALSLSGGGISPAKPTRAQRRELRRAVRQRGLVWGVSPSYLGAYSWVWLALGFLTIFGMSFFLWTISDPNAIWVTKAESGVAEILIGMIALGVGIVVIGPITLRLWWRQRTLRSQSEATCEGIVESWASSHSFFSGRDEMLARITLDNGASEVFRASKMWAYRVQRIGARIRVTYDPASGLVEDVQTVIL